MLKKQYRMHIQTPLHREVVNDGEKHSSHKTKDDDFETEDRGGEAVKNLVLKAYTNNCLQSHCYVISHSQWVLLFRAASAGTKSRALVLFGYAQTTLNAGATFKFCPHKCNKGLLPTVSICQRAAKLPAIKL